MIGMLPYDIGNLKWPPWEWGFVLFSLGTRGRVLLSCESLNFARPVSFLFKVANCKID
jgi:hypothetical protein